MKDVDIYNDIHKTTAELITKTELFNPFVYNIGFKYNNLYKNNHRFS